LDVNILAVGNLDVNILAVGNLDVDILAVGNLDVDILAVGTLAVAKRTQHLLSLSIDATYLKLNSHYQKSFFRRKTICFGTGKCQLSLAPGLPDSLHIFKPKIQIWVNF
jgi:hypothetical protein